MLRDTDRSPRLEALHLVTLWSVAVVQPIFDVVGRNPEFFVAHAARPFDLIVLVLLLCLLGPACGLLLIGMAGRLGHAARQLGVWMTVGLLVTAIVLQVVKLFADWDPARSVGLAVPCGALIATAYLRYSPVRLFLTFLSPAALVVPVVFLLNPAVAGLLTSTNPEPLDDVTFTTTPPIAMIVFDQLPLVSILDGDGRIDATLYPNFASFSRDAVWFRNASAASEMTETALPAILTGNNPARGRLATADAHPESLLTLLGSRYRLQVMEPLTKLCPETICDYGRPPRVIWFLSVLQDLGVVYLHLVLPDDLTATLPPVTQSWKDFAANDGFLERWNASRTQNRPRLVEGFLDSLAAGDPGDPPPFYFLHVLLPHEPWVYLPSGQTFSPDVHLVGLGRDGDWVDDEWAVARNYQRHLLQVRYADSILGAFLQRLEETGHYDEALVVVTADHGASFRPGVSFRTPTRTSFVDIASVPLLIKRSRQREGSTVARNVTLTDLVPTLAAELGVTLPWDTDGLNAFDSGEPAPATKVLFYDGARDRLETSGNLDDAIAEGVARKFELFGAGDPYGEFRLHGYGDLAGKRLGEFPIRQPSDIAVTLDFPTLFADVDHGADFVPAHITGAVSGQEEASEPPVLAVVLNGVIAGVTKPYAFPVAGRLNKWEVVVDPRLLEQGANVVEVFAVREQPEGALALDAAYADAAQPRANLIREEAARLWGVSSSGFFATEWTGQRPFRWTNGEATLSIPIEGREPPSQLAVEVLMTGAGPKPLVITVNGCTIFDSEIRRRWVQTLPLAPCRVDPPSLDIQILSGVHAPGGGGDGRTLGVAVGSIEIIY